LIVCYKKINRAGGETIIKRKMMIVKFTFNNCQLDSKARSTRAITCYPFNCFKNPSFVRY
jgi:hypothetical protein